MDAGDAPAPAGRGGRELPPPLIPPRLLDSDAPPPGGPGEVASGGVGEGDVPILPVPQRQVIAGEVLDAAQLPGGDPAGGDVHREHLQVLLEHQEVAQVLPEQHAVWDGVNQDELLVLPEQHAVGHGVYHELQVLPDHADRELVAVDQEGIGVGVDRIAPYARRHVGRGDNGIRQGVHAGGAPLPPLGRGRGGDGIGQGVGAGRAALPPLGRGRGRVMEHPRAANVVDLYGPGTNRPDAKGKIVPRLDKKFHSADDSTTALNYRLRELYAQLQDRKADAREADETSGRKAALTIAKEYAKGLSKAEGLRRQIVRARGIPVDKPKGLTKDPLA